MSKLSQLEHIRRLGLPTPAFVGISFQEFSSGAFSFRTKKLTPPFAVRSTFSLEDGNQKSLAGHFLTKLSIGKEDLHRAIKEVFDSYPYQHGQYVIVQEMLEPQISGVLFAYRKGIWKLEYVEGMGENLVSGKKDPFTLILPKFIRKDIFWSSLLKIWNPFSKNHPHKKFSRAFIKLAAFTQKISASNPLSAPIGLDVEFAIVKNKTYILQARPLTTEEEAEELLTSANHKEILPPKPSRLMTSIISASSKHLFGYYQRLDPQLDSRNFIEISAGMPWINLSALLDTMVSWGLPSSLVCESVGAEDVYQVRPRPYQMLRKWPIFLRVLREQLSVVGRTRRWVKNKQRYLLQIVEKRRLIWRNAPEIAFNNWQTDLQVIYVELVSLMQALTGAMSGPVKLFNKLGWLQNQREYSESTEFLHAFTKLSQGSLTIEKFLKEYGHRGFYESDIGQRRFREYSEEELKLLSGDMGIKERTTEPAQKQFFLINLLIKPFLKIMAAREWLRHHAMRYFDILREEITEQLQIRYGKNFDFSVYSNIQLQEMLEGSKAPGDFPLENNISGWDMDTFLWNHHDRRLPLSVLVNSRSLEDADHKSGLGIYPGKIKGQIWKVDHAELRGLEIPKFKSIILLTESLDPGWIPFFIKVDGVLSHVGGILSHASIILRESQIPSITRLPRNVAFETGDWVEMDGKTGKVILLNGAHEG
ncbi:MAG: PEP-utilizing enzyme [Bacteroidia bacterium]|nr:PEP-utilizing enzyme [Bacteroidia bacterium]